MKLRKHEISNDQCGHCYDVYPISCSCGGFIHGELVNPTDDTADWDEEIVATECDMCGGAED